MLFFTVFYQYSYSYFNSSATAVPEPGMKKNEQNHKIYTGKLWCSWLLDWLEGFSTAVWLSYY